MSDLVEHVRDGIARAEIASEWLAVYVQDERPDGWWLGRDELLADGARLADELIAASARGAPSVDRRLLWRGVPGQIAWPVAGTTSRLLAATGRLLRVDPAAVRLRVAVEDDGASVNGVWFAGAALLVAPDDPLAGLPGVDVADTDERMAALAADLAGFMDPVVELVRARSRAGAPGLWASVTDCAVGAFADPRPDDAGPGDRCARAAAFMDACAGTPLARRLRWTAFEHRGEPHAEMRYCACCLAYKWPAEPDAEPRPDGLDPRWDRYCHACPLLPDEEVVHRARHGLEQRFSAEH